MEKVKRENIADFLFSKELDLIGATKESIINFDNWKFKFPMERTKYSSFREYSIKLIMKTFKCNRNKAIDTFEFYWQQFGVRIRN